MWYVVKGRGDCWLKRKIHQLTKQTGEGKTLQSVCGQFFIPIHPVMPIVLEHHPEVRCRKCGPVVQ